MVDQQKKEQVGITKDQLVLAVYDRLTAFNGDPELTQKLASQLGTWCWDQMLHNQQQNRKLMERFISLVDQMRIVQNQYFTGKREVLPHAKAAEGKVDHALKVLKSQLGYSNEKQESRQTELF